MEYANNMDCLESILCIFVSFNVYIMCEYDIPIMVEEHIDDVLEQFRLFGWEVATFNLVNDLL